MSVRAFIVGCKGTELSPEDRAFLREADPWGFILFKRNVESPEQVKALVQDFRDCVGRADAPVLVDQEGGRVQRLQPPHWPKYPPARSFRTINDPFIRREAVRLSARLMAHDLYALGITVDCLPVLDVPVAGAHDVIGDRAYDFDAQEVARLGRAAAEGLLAGCVLPVIKHVPGHGRAGADSHHDLPLVEASLDDLMHQDFLPFQALADMPLAMSAHVVYRALDPANAATVSRKVFRGVIRGQIGYDGLVMSDDVSMKALSGSFRQRAERAIAAGCDIVLHCNGELEEARAVAEGVPQLRGKASRRAKAALHRLKHAPEPFDPVDAHARIAQLLAHSASATKSDAG